MTVRRRLFDLTRRLSNRLFGPELMHRSGLVRGLWAGWRRIVEAFSPAYRRQARFERENPEAPWLVPAAIPFIERELRADMRGLEWGAGRSTLWLARQGLTLVSIEGRRSWRDKVAAWLQRDGLAARVSLPVVDVLRDHDVDPGTIDAYASAPKGFVPPAFDVVLVDGHFRSACLRRVPTLLAPGGLLIVDNAEVADVRDQIARLAPHRIGDFDNGIWLTHVYRAPAEGLPPLD